MTNFLSFDFHVFLFFSHNFSCVYWSVFHTHTHNSKLEETFLRWLIKKWRLVSCEGHLKLLFNNFLLCVLLSVDVLEINYIFFWLTCYVGFFLFNGNINIYLIMAYSWFGKFTVSETHKNREPSQFEIFFLDEEVKTIFFSLRI